MRIATNIPALNTALTLQQTDRRVVGAMRRLSSGSKINSAKDDAAGLAIANKLSVQVTGLNRASQNSMDGISLIQTADGSLNGISNILQRMRELAVQAASGVLDPSDKNKIQMEINQLVQEINANAYKTEFNKIKIISGEADTLTENMTELKAYGGSIASVLYISPSFPPGLLKYKVKSPGLPAEASIDLTALLDEIKLAALSGQNVTLTLNEISVEITGNDTLDVIKGKLSDAANLASLELKFVHTDTDQDIAFFVTKTAGSSQTINITGAVPPVVHTAPGTDAALEIKGFTPAITGAGSALSGGGSYMLSDFYVRADGNQITISDAKGQSIRLGLKVSFNPTGAPPSLSDFAYGDGQYAFAPPYDTGTPADTPMDMQAAIKDYGPLYLQTGPNFNQRMPVSIPRLDAESLGFIEHTGGMAKIILDYQSIAGAGRAIGMVDRAIAEVSRARAWLGAYQNRLEQTVMILDTTGINMEAARSRIQDTDMAAAMTEYTQYSVNYQAGIAILAQANQRPQQILSLLQ